MSFKHSIITGTQSTVHTLQIRSYSTHAANGTANSTSFCSHTGTKLAMSFILVHSLPITYIALWHYAGMLFANNRMGAVGLLVLTV